MPLSASKISELTASTAIRTPLPWYRLLSPSRSSTASCAPVEAPEGTAARPRQPSSSTTSTSTVGLPRESRISRARRSTIMVMTGSGGGGFACFYRNGLPRQTVAGGKRGGANAYPGRCSYAFLGAAASVGAPAFFQALKPPFIWATGSSPISIAVFAASAERQPPAQKKTKRLSSAKTGL